MVQSVLLFSLGFLCAAFLALMIAPAIWRRAVLLTRKRIEASVPLTLNEIQADKDRMRAEFAMSTRRLEMSVKNFREKAAAQVAEINRNRQELKHLSEARDVKALALSQLETQAAALRKELAQREQQLDQVSERLAEAEQTLEARAGEIDRLSQLNDELSVASSNRQIELVSRDTQIEKLSTDVDSLRAARRENEKQMRQLEADEKSARRALGAETKKLKEAEKKIERLMASLSDREDKLERRDKELARLRAEQKSIRAEVDAVTQEITEAGKEKVELEARLAEMTLQMTNLLSQVNDGTVEKAVEGLTEDRSRIATELKALKGENEALRENVSMLERSKTDDWDDQKRENAILREQINDLAAEVVAMTAMLEGPASPIGEILRQPASANAALGGDGDVTSLASRVRALQKAAASRAK